MSCKRCGGASLIKVPSNIIEFNLDDNAERSVTVGAKSAILLKGLREGDQLLRTGKVIKLSAADAAQLQNKGAPIWIIS